MSEYSKDEALSETVLALECEHAACIEQRRLTEQARAVAAHLEAENARLRELLSHVALADVGRPGSSSVLREFQRTGVLDER